MPPAPLSRITLEWTVTTGPWPTGLQGTTNFVTWYTLTNMGQRLGTVRCTLSNRPPYEFYRAFTSF